MADYTSRAENNMRTNDPQPTVQLPAEGEPVADEPMARTSNKAEALRNPEKQYDPEYVKDHRGEEEDDGPPGLRPNYERIKSGGAHSRTPSAAVQEPLLKRNQSTQSNASTVYSEAEKESEDELDEKGRITLADHKWYHYLKGKRKHVQPVPRSREHCPEAS